MITAFYNWFTSYIFFWPLASEWKQQKHLFIA